MGEYGAICRLGVFYDGTFFTYAQNYYYHERQLGWLRFPEFHHFLEKWIGLREQEFASYKVVYAAWHQGLYTSKDATAEQLKRDRNRHHDLMHAGVEPKYLPMSQKHGEKGVDVALAVDALQVGLGKMIDVAVLVTGDGDFVPLSFFVASQFRTVWCVRSRRDAASMTLIHVVILPVPKARGPGRASTSRC